jgi:hypothetical protein
MSEISQAVAEGLNTSKILLAYTAEGEWGSCRRRILLAYKSGGGGGFLPPFENAAGRILLAYKSGGGRDLLVE